MPTDVLVRMDKGRFNPEKVVNLPQKLGDGDSVTLSQAIKILGYGKVITAEQSAKARGMKMPQNTPIRYNEESIRQCDDENRNGQDWRMIHCFGLSLRALRDKFGQQWFNKFCTWWLRSKEDVWATKNPLAGYYLINVRGRFDAVTWCQQQEAIVKIGNVERCHEAIFAEAILTIFKFTGERIAEDWWHWAASASSHGSLVCVGRFGSDGLRVCAANGIGRYALGKRVSLFRKFDF